MPSVNDVEKLALELHEGGALNLDTPLRDLLKPQGIGVIDPNSPIADNAVAWSDYVLITKGKTGPIDDLVKVAEIAQAMNKITKP